MNLDTTITIDLKGFFHWWGRELAFLVPKSVRRQLREHCGRLVFFPSERGFELRFFDDDGNPIVTQRLDDLENGAYHEFKERYPSFEKAEIVLRLPAHQALQKVIFLPMAAQENLQQVVGFELDRYTPFSADQVYFTALPLGTSSNGQIQVLLIAVPKKRLDDHISLLESFDIRPHRVDYQAAAEAFPQTLDTYNLLPDQFKQRGSQWGLWLHWALGAVMLLMLVAVSIWPVWTEGRMVEVLKARVKHLEDQNRVVEAQQAQIDALYAESKKLIDIKRQSPALLSILNELSRLLKDDTWLTHLKFSGQHIQIQGQSPAASSLIGVLEESAFFTNVSFVSPLTQDKTTGRERFQIGMDIGGPPSSPSEEQTSAVALPASVPIEAETADENINPAFEGGNDE